MIRDVFLSSPTGNIPRNASKTAAKSAVTKKAISEDIASVKRKTEMNVPKADFTDDDADENFTGEKELFNKINTEFVIQITDLFSLPSGVNPVPYIFEVNDMVKEVDASEEDQRKPPEKNPKKVVSKVIRDTIKPSKEIMWQSPDRDEFGSIDSAERIKIEM